MFYTKKRFLLPIKIGICFSLSTYILFRFGVFNFEGRDSWLLLFLVLVYNISMYLGFCFGGRFSVNRSSDLGPERTLTIAKKLFNVCFWITMLTIIPQFIIQTGMYDGDILSVLNKAISSFSNAAETYHLNRLKSSAEGIWTIINYVCVLTQFISWAYTYLVIILWHKISKRKRLCTVLFWGLVLLENAAKGTNFGYFEFLIAIGTGLLVRQIVIAKVQKKKKNNSVGTSRAIILVVAVIAIICLFVFMFGNVMNTRVGDSYYKLIETGSSYVPIDYDSIFFTLCPTGFLSTFVTLMAYLTQGYYGLYLSTKVSFTSTFGFGDSWFKIFNIQDLFGVDIIPNTYLYKIYESFGYHYSNNWHTAYVWFGNDVSLALVPVVLFIICAIWGYGWNNFLRRGNAFGLLTFITFPTFIAFISANNQVFSSAQTLFAFWVYFIVLLKTKEKYDWSLVFTPEKDAW